MLILIALLAIGATSPRGCSSCHVVRSLRLRFAKARFHPAPDPPSPPLACPALNASPVPPLLQGEGGHRVILSWKASAPANSRHDIAVGYCIYRVLEEEKGGGKENKDELPQLVNPIAFRGTRCADDGVKNSRKYRYVVRAIGFRAQPSDPSNVAATPIPAEGKRSSSVEAPAPLCREPEPAK